MLGKRFSTFLPLALIFLIALNFYNKAYVLFYVLVMALFIIKGDRKIECDRNLIVLLFFSIFMLVSSLFFEDEPIYELILKAFAYPMAYLVGYQYQANSKDISEERLYNTMLAMSIGYILHLILNLFNGNTLYFIKNFNRRWLEDIWIHGEIPATIASAWCIPLGSIVYYTLFSGKCNIVKKILVLILAIVCVLIHFLIGTRSFLYIFALSFVISYAYDSYLLKRGQEERRNIKFYRKAFIIVLVSAFIIIYTLNLFGIKDYIGNSILMNRYTAGELSDGNAMSSNGRIEGYFYLITHCMDSIWGGGFAADNNYSQHNWFMQCYDLYGLFTATFFGIFLTKLVKTSARLLHSQHLDSSIKLLWVGIFSSLFFEMMIEPIFSSNPILGLFLIMVFGYINRYYRSTYIIGRERGK